MFEQKQPLEPPSHPEISSRPSVSNIGVPGPVLSYTPALRYSHDRSFSLPQSTIPPATFRSHTV